MKQVFEDVEREGHGHVVMDDHSPDISKFS